MTLRQAAEPLEGNRCFKCGAVDHDAKRCQRWKEGELVCEECGGDHAVEMCFLRFPELDFRKWEDGVAYPGEMEQGSVEHAQYVRRVRRAQSGSRR